MTKHLATEIQKEIDEGVLLSVLVEGGWTKVQFKYYDVKHAVNVMDWCTLNVKENQWKRLADSFVFRKKEDAEWFILRWQ